MDTSLATAVQKPVRKTVRVRPNVLGIVIADGLTSEIMARILLTGPDGVRSIHLCSAGLPRLPGASCSATTGHKKRIARGPIE